MYIPLLPKNSLDFREWNLHYFRDPLNKLFLNDCILNMEYLNERETNLC